MAHLVNIRLSQVTVMHCEGPQEFRCTKVTLAAW